MKKESPDIGFRLMGIKTEQFAVFENNYYDKLKADLSIELQFKLDQKTKKIGVFLGFEFSEQKKVFLKIVVSCHFNISENSWNNFLTNNQNKIIVPKGFLAHIAMITTGTTRGVLFAKTESTPFSKFIVPTLNVNAMIKEDASFDMVVE